VDSHTHILFAGNRITDYLGRIRGESYEEQFLAGRGILHTAKAVREASDEQLLTEVLERINEMMLLGTTALEIKSGYGLSVTEELRLLRLIKTLKQYAPLTISSTLLIHAIPPEYQADRKSYLDLVCQELIPQTKSEGLADSFDTFCETGFFAPAEVERMLVAANEAGLSTRLHANQFEMGIGIQMGGKHKVRAMSHLNRIGEAEAMTLTKSEILPILLPGVAFFLGLSYPPARRLIDLDKGLALASGYNPGTSPSGSMPFVLSVACSQLKLLPAEALAAATLNGAYALGLQQQHGSLAPGKRADILISRLMDSFEEIPYYFTRDSIDQIIVAGKLFS
jgi:imidazolonepropionase